MDSASAFEAADRRRRAKQEELAQLIHLRDLTRNMHAELTTFHHQLQTMNQVYEGVAGVMESWGGVFSTMKTVDQAEKHQDDMTDKNAAELVLVPVQHEQQRV